MKNKKIIASILMAFVVFVLIARINVYVADDIVLNYTGEDDYENLNDLKGEGKYQLIDEPITLSACIMYDGKIALKDELEIPIEISKYTNILVSGVDLKTNNGSENFHSIMQMQVLPDLIGGQISDIYKYVPDGAFLPLNTLIDNFAPNIKAVFEQYPEVVSLITTDDGEIYCIPFINDQLSTRGWFIRQDWLDNLELEMPTNFNEFEEVLYAFRDNDPNNNGIADEIPLFARNTTDNNKIASYLQIFGINSFFHVKDGKVQVGTYTNEYKNAMQGVAKWFEDEIVFLNELNINDNTRDYLLKNDLSGVTFDWIASTSNYNNTIDYDDFSLQPMIFSDINGEIWTAYSKDRATGYGWSISLDNKRPIASIKYMDFLFSQKGRELTTYGVEDVNFYYNLQNIPTYTEQMLEGNTSIMTKINAQGGSIEAMAYFYDSSYEYNLMNQSGKDAFDMYNQITTQNRIPQVNFTAEELAIINSVYPICEQYILDKTHEWVYNSILIEEEFEEYMNTLKELGMDKVIETYQSAYNRLLKNLEN